MYCVYCGGPITEGDKFCRNCGAPVRLNMESDEKEIDQETQQTYWYNNTEKKDSMGNDEQSTQGKAGNKGLIIGAVIVCIIIIVIAVVYFLSSSDEYFEGLKWGSSVETVQSKYNDLYYEESTDSYWATLESIPGYNSPVNVEFKFNNDMLYEVNANIEDGDESYAAYVYYIDLINRLNGSSDYEATPDNVTIYWGTNSIISLIYGPTRLQISYTDIQIGKTISSSDIQ